MSSSKELRKQIEQSHVALKEYFSPKRQHESASNPAQLILFAEHAAKYGCGEIALDCLRLYFSLNPPTSQFFIRAHLCEALIIAPGNPTEEDRLLQALDSVTKAVTIAKKSECYHFLVFNASVILWQICRPFQRNGCRRLFVKPLATVVKALDECKEQDYTWRLELLMGLTLSQLDAGHKEEAAKTCSTAIHLARKRVPKRLFDVLKIQVSRGLGESKPAEKMSSEYSALCRLYKTKSAISQQGLRGPELEQRLQKILTFITKGDEGLSGRKTATQSPLPPPVKESRPPLLLDLCTLCVEHHLANLAQDCLRAVSMESIQNNPELLITKEMLSCQLMIQSLGEDEESYARKSVEVRRQVLVKMEVLLTSALGSEDAELIQSVCVTQWNISLPLLQLNLRHQLFKPLSSVAKALEKIDSVLFQLRAVLHFELAKICADVNQLQAGLEHLEKASSLDFYSEYDEQIKVFHNKLLLRAQLYQVPDHPVDKSIKIIEQVCSIAESSSVEETRAMFMKAGELLAPGYFTRVVLGDMDTSATSTPAPEIALQIDEKLIEVLEQKGRKLKCYKFAKEQVEACIKSQHNMEDKKRCHTWADLAKAARKLEVWDVAMVAALFCIQYDNIALPKQISTKSSSKQPESSTHINRSPSPRQQERASRKRSSPRLLAAELSALRHSTSKQLDEQSKERVKKENIRTLAGAYCIFAECLVHELQQDGLKLGVKPLPKSITSGPADFTDNEQWNFYLDWADLVTADAHNGFLRTAELGCVLGESWLVCNASAYLWNYNHHWIERNQLTEVVSVFRPLLESMKQVSLRDEGILLTQVCTALAGGLVQKWIPKPTTGRAPTARGTTAKKGGRADSKKGKSGTGDQLQVDPDAGPDLKEALEVCEYGMSVSVAVPLSIRGGILSVWVQCKQLLQQPIPSKTFGIDESPSDPCVQNCRAVVAIEMISRLGNRIWDFPGCPSLHEAYSLLSECEWSDGLAEMDLWVRFADIAFKQKDYDLVCKSSACAANIHKSSKEKLMDSSSVRVVNELLSLVSSIQGQSLSTIAAGNVATVRKALAAFHDCASYGHAAGNYSLVIEGCYHYWNTCLPLVTNPLERNLLREPLSELLELVASLIGGRKKKRKVEMEMDDKNREKDYHLLISMYGVVFQAYIDKKNWDEGLKAVENAMWIMPKGVSRQLAKHKLLFKSRMGKNVDGDMVKYQEEPEEFVGSLWYKAASNATDPRERLKAYQNAIQELQSENHSWQKVDYLLELSEWLYQQQFPVHDALDQLQLVVSILLNIKPDKIQPNGDMTEENVDPGQPHSTSSHPQTPMSSKPSDSRTKEDTKTVTSVRQLEALMRVHIVMAQLYGSGNEEHQRQCIAALGYCSQIWKQTLQTVSGTSEGGKSTTGIQLPNTVEQWALFGLPEQLIEQINTSSTHSSLNKHTIRKPMLTVHYLGVLVKFFSTLGLHPLVFPVLNLQLAILKGMIANSESACQLLHMRMEVLCMDMGLSTAALAHREKIGDQILNPEDLARSQVEIEEYKAKKEAIEKESSKRTISAQFSVLAKRESQSPTKASENPFQKQPEPISDCIVVRKVWVDQAMLLIQQSQYQEARELLNKALESCQVFNDKYTLFQVTLGLAALAFAEDNAHQAIQLFTDAQQLPSQLDAWLEGILLLSDSVMISKDYKNQHFSLMDRLLVLLQSVTQQSKNEEPRVEYATAILRARQTLCCLKDDLAASGDRILLPDVTNQMLEKCEVVSKSACTLLSQGHCRESAQLFSQLAHVFRTMAENFPNTCEEHQKFLLKALHLYQRAVDSLNGACEMAVTLCQPSEEVTLPIQRELVTNQLCVAELLLVIFSEYSADLRTARTKLEQKSSIEKLIDDYVRETPVLSIVEEEWITTAKLSVDRVLSILSSAHSTAKNDRHLKAQCMYHLGHCLYLMSIHSSPDHGLQWEYHVTDCNNGDSGKDGEGSEDGDGVEEDVETTEENEELGSGATADGCGDKTMQAVLGGTSQYSVLSTVMRKEDADKAELEEASSLHLIPQACHLLAEAVSMALNIGDWCLGMKAALKLVECFGAFDPVTASQYLALYQSLATAQEMKHHLDQILSDPQSTKLGALFKQNTRLCETSEVHDSSPALQANIDELKKFEVYKRLQVSDNHLEFLRSFPSHFRFIVLHHSPDKSQLYASYLIPPQPPPPAPKKGQPPPQVELLEPVIAYVDVCPKDLVSLLELVKDFQLANGQKILRSLVSDFDSLFSDVLIAMEVYLSGVIKPISDAISKENSEKELNIVLLADTELMQLPLEAMSCLHRENIHSVTRDFSLQMLYHRISRFTSEEEGDSLKDKKKTEKYQPQPTTLLANIASFKYVLDPSGDLKQTKIEDTNPCNGILSKIQMYSKVTSKWSGYSGSEEHVLSVSGWPPLLGDCSGLVFFGTERLLAHFPPTKLAPLNLQECSVALVMDRMQTVNSALKQSKLDYHKSDLEVEFEQPMQSVMLLSLVGCGCILSNQWNASIQDNLDKTNAMIQGLLSQSATVGTLNWKTVRDVVLKEKSKEAEPCDEESSPPGDIDEEKESPGNDDTKQDDHDSKPLVSPYNCVVYGLPHITFIAPTI